MSLLWSLSVNCLVEIYLKTSRFWQILIITVVDNFGKSLLNCVFVFAHLRCLGRLYRQFCMRGAEDMCAPDALGGRSPIFLPFFIAFLGLTASALLTKMTPEELYNSGYSFFPLWAFSRLTELFYWGAFWAFLVQYGSSQSGRRTFKAMQRRRAELERDRQRRVRLMESEQPWWNLRFRWWPWGRTTRVS